MMRLSYSFKLARTKLRSKRAILWSSIIVASLLFATLIATVIIFTGAEKSADEFIKKAGSDKYLVKTRPNIPYEKLGFLYTNLPVEEIREIKAFEKKYYLELQDTYKALGLEYDKKSEIPALEPYALADERLPEEQRVRVNEASPVIQALNQLKFETYRINATNKVSDLKNTGAKYGASGYYVVDQPSSLPTIPQLRLIQNNQEDFRTSEPKTGGDFGDYGYYTNAIYNGMYNFTDEKNLSRYIPSSGVSELKGIPVVVSAQEAASLFGKEFNIGQEPESAPDKKEWLKLIQTKLSGKTYQACYRNSVEQTMLEKIQRDFAEIKNNEKVSDYQKPSLIYDYPNGVCGDIVTKVDGRTVAEKQVESDKVLIEKKLGIYIPPKHKLLTFQIVGVKYAHSSLDYTAGVEDYIKSLLVQQSDSSHVEIPIQLYETLPASLKFEDIRKEESTGTVALDALSTDDFSARILEFSNIDNARNFLENETCSSNETTCDKNFFASTYGSNYLILDEINKLFTKIVWVAFPLALSLAAIIVWFTISRIMAENRKETAVYRAMGAKRHDISMIYLVYIFIISLKIVVISSALGILASVIIDQAYGRTLADTATTAFGIIDSAPKFNLFSLESPLLLVIIGCIFLICFVASIQPLFRNTMRPPIRDIRDE